MQKTTATACRAIILSIFFLLNFVVITPAQSTWKAPDEANNLTSPFKNKAAAAESGKVFFNAICFVCHGNTGKGDGINAASLERKPADLTSSKVQKQSDGAIFWKITEGNPPMLRFKETLSEEVRWQLVAYVRTLGGRLTKKVAIAKVNKKNKSTVIATKGSNVNIKIPIKKTAVTRSSEIVNINPYRGMSGTELFTNICGACHTVGEGIRIGPDLMNVQNRYSKEWIYKWVHSSKALIDSGDKEAIKIFKKFKKVRMPDQPLLSNAQIDEILDFISTKSEKITAERKRAIATRYIPKPPEKFYYGYFVAFILSTMVVLSGIYYKMG